MRVYGAEGNNIQTSNAMKEAIDSNGGVCGVQTAVVDIDTSKQNITNHSLKGVTKFTNVEFTPAGMKVWQAYNIGAGYLIEQEEIKKLCSQEQNATGAVIIQDFEDNHQTSGRIHIKDKSTPDEIEPRENICEMENQGNQNEHDDDSNLFCCPENGCVKSYQTYNRLQEHLLFGRHEYKLLKESSFDQVKKLWASKCDQISIRSQLAAEPDSVLEKPCEPMGWSLKKERKIIRHSQKVKTYLTDVFNKGAKTGKKANAATVAIEMRTLCEDGQRKFSPHEWLQPSQITSFFSRLALNSRQGKQKRKVTQDNENEDDDDLQHVLNLLENEQVLDNIENAN